MDGDQAIVTECVRRALSEDLDSADADADADVTSRLAVPTGLVAEARIHCKARGVLAGLDCAAAAFRALDPRCRLELRRRDGDPVVPGDVVLAVAGRMRALLAAERTALNFLQRLSGVATVTAAFVAAVQGTGARILDTRKTTPGLRLLEKRAVRAGGGHNHRFGLFDQVLLKENHFAFAGAGHAALVASVKAAAPSGMRITAEARDLDEALAAADGGADVLLLDNFSVAGLAETVARLEGHPRRGRFLIEASGGVNLATVSAIARSGVDRISVGALTHSAPALDLSMLIDRVPQGAGGGRP